MRTRVFKRLSFFAVALASLPLYAQQGAPATAAGEGRVEVPVLVCRILDTRLAPASQPATGDVRVPDTRCAQLVPPNATAYMLRTTTYNWRLPEDASGPPSVSTSTVPVQANGPLHFPTPFAGHVTVDLIGYVLPPGSVAPPQFTGSTNATGPAASVVRAVSANAAGVPARIAPADVVGGTAGEVRVDASPYSWAGVFLRGSTASKWIAAQTMTSDPNSGIVFLNSSGAGTMVANGDGSINLPGAAGYLNGRTDFLNGNYTAVHGNIVHNVALLAPRDTNGAAVNRVVLYNSATTEENGSPATTKFQAFTLGYYNQANINFDSQFRYHNTNQYHYRAYAVLEGKDTFWVRPNYNVNVETDTRADMYVSGKVGIGTTSPVAKMEVVGNAGIGGGIAGNARSDFSYLTISRAGSSDRRAGLAFRQSAVDTFEIGTDLFVNNTNNLYIYDSVSHAARLIITPSGTIGIGTETPSPSVRLDVVGNANFSGTVTGGNIQAKYQDVAEWVPASEDMAPGTVVVLDPTVNNRVKASSHPYDTSVAGVVSAQPGLVLGEGSASKEMVATTGRVHVRVDAHNGSIAIGDLLVTSDVKGVAMKSQPIDLGGTAIHRPGTIIGKALEPLTTGAGEILVLLSMQ